MAAPTPGGDVELRDPPTDGITTARFSPWNVSWLLVSSWDSQVRLYDVNSNTLRAAYHHAGPVLDCTFSNRNTFYSGGLDRVVKEYDPTSGAEYQVGQHNAPVRCVEFHPEHELVISGGWDSAIKLWDSRTRTPVGTHPQPFLIDLTQDRVYTMALSNHRLIVGTAGRYVNIYDLRRMDEPEQRRESSLKYQTRCIRAFPNGQGYALSSIEGRVAIEYFDPSPEVQAKKYAFKCHRVLVNGVDTVYPVNTIAVHPTYGSFATGGCDGIVNIWDGENKKRLSQLAKYPTSIAYLSFSADGQNLAVASSYTFEEGDKDHPPDTVFIHRVQDAEVKPKPRVVPV